MARAGLLGRGIGHVDAGEVAIARAIISMQGVSYQAAQYLGKILAAEAWSTGAHSGQPLHVSANTAAITATPSMDKPLFQVAFRGSGAFGIEIFAPETTRRLNGLLMIRDWLDPGAPGHLSRSREPERLRAEALLRQRVHGGTHGMAYPAEPTIRMCGLLGLLRLSGSPSAARPG